MAQETFAQFIARVEASAHGYGTTRARGSIVSASHELTRRGRPSFRFTVNGVAVARAVVAQLMGA